MIRKCKVSDIKEIVELHSKNLKEGILSSLNPKALELVYREFIADRNSFVLAYQEKNRIVRVVASTAGIKKLYSIIKRKHYLRIGFFLLIRYLKSPLKLAKLLFSSSYHYSTDAELVFIYVDANARGSGIGGKLVRRGDMEFKKMGVKEYKISTLASNKKTVRFYEKHGFKKAGSFYYLNEKRVTYIKPLN